MSLEHRATSILNALQKQTKTGHLCDVLFYNGNETVWAHSCVLAGFSPVFDRMFSLNLANTHYWSLKQPMQITVDNANKFRSDAISNCIQCLAQVVKFIYTGRIKPNALHLRHLFTLSERLRSRELFKICEKYQSKHSLLNSTDEGKSLAVVETSNVQKTIGGDESKVVERCTNDETVILTNEKVLSLAECSVCHFFSEDSKKLEIHERIFHCNSYKCFYCETCHKSVTSLLDHMENECKADHLICSVCLHEGHSTLELMSHLKEHRSPKPFSCPLCDNTYDRRSVWLKHIRVHSLKTKYPCSACGVKFNTACECAKHEKAVHAPKKHVCGRCGFTAAFPYLLEKHQQKHRQILNCDQSDCDYRTTSESQLIRHKSIHKDKKHIKVDKSHECSVCNIKFSLHKNLKRHMKIHDSKDSKIKCPLCGYETSRTDKFNDHMEFKHGRAQVQEDGVHPPNKTSHHHTKNQTDDTGQPMSTNLTFSEHISKPQNSARETTYSVESFSRKHNTLLMNDEGDISIVNTNEKNSVTLRNIGNLTGSITLDEKTGVLTMNNINSGSVFLNETTGELTYINLENDNYYFNSDSIAPGDNFKNQPQLSTEMTKLDEVTGEIIKVSPTNEEVAAPDQDFDYFDMDVNDDSLDGFDDFDEVLFDVFCGNDPEFDRVSLRDDPSFTSASVMPHLDESTGLLTFDENLKNRDQSETWNASYSQRMENDSNGEEAYKLLLDEVTGVLHD